MVESIGRVYQIERLPRKQQLDAPGRLQLRQRPSVATVSAVKA